MPVDQSARRRSRTFQGRVVRTERVTPNMARVVLGGEGIRGFVAGPFTDRYIKLIFPRTGVRHAQPFDLAAVRRELSREQWPRTRTYTVRRWDPSAGELTVDFVLHGTDGLAGPWAARAQPGDLIHFSGPGGGYAPKTDAGWHLLAGDESALPAIAAALEDLPAGVVVKALVEVSGPAEEQPIETSADARIVWLHRGDRQVGETLCHAVSSMTFPAGRVQAFVHGEAHSVKSLRRHLRAERAVPPEQMSISGYWRRGADEDGWQASKADWNQDPDERQAVRPMPSLVMNENEERSSHAAQQAP
ncbi:siderophore-interacting protein [Streptomyces prunicolor]|uniref:Siderophore-interacting protein n=1 Tax=Streptomyces prunicolor TaxID=67348 RepID=A0ABU4FFM3_9ACTN|nr:siderophore-interacting protein [Streptomyces prunicolor]MDV7219369.1 siderophore-interacting protein [Streptomyces prunicolor]